MEFRMSWHRLGGPHMSLRSASRIWLSGHVFALLAIAGATSAAAQTTSNATPTFTNDVAPILQRSCQRCHRPGSIGPMSLQTYEDVRPWARSIRAQVTSRAMPPWHIDRNVGVRHFKDDPSLSTREIETIANWIDAGSPRGNP